MPFQVFTFNPFQENTYLLWNSHKEAILFDPGMENSNECNTLVKFLEDNNLNLTEVLLTHAHIDHILGCDFIFQKFGIKPKLYVKDKTTFSFARQSADMWGINYTDSPEPIYFSDDEIFEFGDLKLEWRFVPGHAMGHVIFINKAENIAIVGDTIFRQSIGRTDLLGGNHEQLLNKIKTEIFTLNDSMILYPGHGPETTVGYEKEYNPFLK